MSCTTNNLKSQRWTVRTGRCKEGHYTGNNVVSWGTVPIILNCFEVTLKLCSCTSLCPEFQEMFVLFLTNLLLPECAFMETVHRHVSLNLEFLLPNIFNIALESKDFWNSSQNFLFSTYKFMLTKTRSHIMLQDAPLYVDSTHRLYINSLLCDVIYCILKQVLKMFPFNY
jgi:hypothetical protein